MTKRRVMAMILKGFPRISETFIINEILQLEKRGVHLHIFSMRKPREPFFHESVAKIRARVDYLPEGILGRLFPLLYHNFMLLAKERKRYGSALALAAKRFFRTGRMATLKHLLQAGYLVHRFLKDSPVVHFHAHFAHSPSSVALYANVLSGIPYSFTAHAKDIYTTNEDQLKEKIARAAFVITCTDYNRRHLVRLARGIPTPVYLSYHGISLSLFRAGEARDLQAPYRILTVARLTQKKGITTILKALSLLKRRKIPFSYTLIGDGEMHGVISSLIRELELTGEVTLTGTLTHDAVVEHYRKADLFVLGCCVSADGDRDGIPNVLAESMAMGVPVVVPKVSAIPELIEHGKTGLLIPPEDPERMAGAMLKILFNRKLKERIARDAFSFVQGFFDNEKRSEELFEILKSHVELTP